MAGRDRCVATYSVQDWRDDEAYDTEECPIDEAIFDEDGEWRCPRAALDVEGEDLDRCPFHLAPERRDAIGYRQADLADRFVREINGDLAGIDCAADHVTEPVYAVDFGDFSAETAARRRREFLCAKLGEFEVEWPGEVDTGMSGNGRTDGDDGVGMALDTANGVDEGGRLLRPAGRAGSGDGDDDPDTTRSLTPDYVHLEAATGHHVLFDGIETDLGLSLHGIRLDGGDDVGLEIERGTIGRVLMGAGSIAGSDGIRIGQRADVGRGIRVDGGVVEGDSRGILVDGGTVEADVDADFGGIHVGGGTVDGFDEGILVEGGIVDGYRGGILVDGGTVHGVRVGIRVDGGTVRGLQAGLRVSGGTVDGFEGGILVEGGTVGERKRGIFVDGGTVDGGGEGILVDGGTVGGRETGMLVAAGTVQGPRGGILVENGTVRGAREGIHLDGGTVEGVDRGVLVDGGTVGDPENEATAEVDHRGLLIGGADVRAEGPAVRVTGELSSLELNGANGVSGPISVSGADVDDHVTVRDDSTVERLELLGADVPEVRIAGESVVTGLSVRGTGDERESGEYLERDGTLTVGTVTVEDGARIDRDLRITDGDPDRAGDDGPNGDVDVGAIACRNAEIGRDLALERYGGENEFRVGRVVLGTDTDRGTRPSSATVGGDVYLTRHADRKRRRRGDDDRGPVVEELRLSAATVEGGVYALDSDLGGVDVTGGTDVGTELRIEGCHLDDPGPRDTGTVGTEDAERRDGGVGMTGTDVDGTTGGVGDSEGGEGSPLPGAYPGVRFDDATVRRDVRIGGCTGTGVVEVTDAAVGGDLSLRNSELAGVTVDDGTDVEKRLLFDDVVVSGRHTSVADGGNGRARNGDRTAVTVGDVEVASDVRIADTELDGGLTFGTTGENPLAPESLTVGGGIGIDGLRPPDTGTGSGGGRPAATDGRRGDDATGAGDGPAENGIGPLRFDDVTTAERVTLGGVVAGSLTFASASVGAGVLLTRDTEGRAATVDGQVTFEENTTVDGNVAVDAGAVGELHDHTGTDATDGGNGTVEADGGDVEPIRVGGVAFEDATVRNDVLATGVKLTGVDDAGPPLCVDDTDVGGKVVVGDYSDRKAAGGIELVDSEVDEDVRIRDPDLGAESDSAGEGSGDSDDGENWSVWTSTVRLDDVIVDGKVTVRGMHVDEELTITRSRVDESVRFGVTPDDGAVSDTTLEVQGDLRVEETPITENVEVTGVEVCGDSDGEGGDLAVEDSQVGGRIVVERTKVEGTLALNDLTRVGEVTRIGTVGADGGTGDAPDPDGDSAGDDPRTQVGAVETDAVFERDFELGCTVTGAAGKPPFVDLSATTVEGETDLRPTFDSVDDCDCHSRLASWVDLRDATLPGGTLSVTAVEGDDSRLWYDLRGATVGDLTVEPPADDGSVNVLDHLLLCDTTFDGFRFSNLADELDARDYLIHDVEGIDPASYIAGGEPTPADRSEESAGRYATTGTGTSVSRFLILGVAFGLLGVFLAAGRHLSAFLEVLPPATGLVTYLLGIVLILYHFPWVRLRGARWSGDRDVPLKSLRSLRRTYLKAKSGARGAGDESIAGRFFVREKRYKRLVDHKTGPEHSRSDARRARAIEWFEPRANALFDSVAAYGERPSRIILWVLAVVSIWAVIFSLLIGLSGTLPYPDQTVTLRGTPGSLVRGLPSFVVAGANAFGQAVLLSIDSFVTLMFVGLQEGEITVLMHVFGVLEGFLGVVFAALLVFTLTRSVHR